MQTAMLTIDQVISAFVSGLNQSMWIVGLFVGTVVGCWVLMLIIERVEDVEL